MKMLITGGVGFIASHLCDKYTREVQRLIADNTKARKLLGWESKYNFEDGLKEFVQWYKNYGLEERIKFEWGR